MNDQLSKYFSALSNPIRLQIFCFVARKSEGSAPENKQDTCVCEIADDLKIPQPTVSNHLKKLESVGLVKSVKVGTKSYQYVTKDASKNILDFANFMNEQAKKHPY